MVYDGAEPHFPGCSGRAGGLSFLQKFLTVPVNGTRMISPAGRVTSTAAASQNLMRGVGRLAATYGKPDATDICMCII